MTRSVDWRKRLGDEVRLIGARARRSLLRLDLAPLPRTTRVLVAAARAMTLVIAWLLVLPGLVDTVSLSAIGLHNGLSFAEPLWYRTVFFTAAAIVAASFSAVVTSHPAGAAVRTRALGGLAVVGLAGYPVLLMAADWSRQATIAGLIAAASAVVVALLPAGSPRSVSRRVAWVSALTATAWLVMVPAQQRLDRGYDWAWNGTWSAGILFAVFGGVYAIARAVERRSGRIRPLARTRIGPLGAAVATIVAVIFVVARMTVALDWFGAQEGALWEQRDPISWIHAVVVAAVIAVSAIRSQQVPRAQRGGTIAVLLLVLGATAPFVLWVIVFLSALVSAAFGGPVSLEILRPGGGLLLGVSLIPLVVLAVVPWSRRSVGRTAAVVAIALFLPALPGYLAGEALGMAVPPYLATPAQVVAVIVAACVAVMVASAITRRAVVAYHLVVLLAIVPLIAVTGGLLLPAAVSGVVGHALVVAGSLAAVLFGMPRVAADPLRRSRDAVRFTGFTLLVLASYVTSIGQFARYDEPLQGFAVDWLALPLATVLCCRTLPRTSERASVDSHAQSSSAG